MLTGLVRICAVLGAGLLTSPKPSTEGLLWLLRPSVSIMCGVRDPRTTY